MIKESPWYMGLQDPLAHWFLNFAKDRDNLLQFKLGSLDKALTEGMFELNKEAFPPSEESMIAIDCEMVQVEVPYDAITSKASPAKKQSIPGLPEAPPPMQTKVALARVSIVDFHGKVLLDTFCKPKEVVVDYKTKYSGVTEEDLVDAPSVRKVQKYVAKLVKDKFIVGQSLENDLSVLNLQLPLERVRDTASYYRRFHPRGKFIGLRDLAKLNLGLEIQRGAHDSIIDARVAMLLYKQLRGIWERSMPIYEESDADTCFPVPFSFPQAFRDAIAVIASVDINLPLPPLVPLNPEEAKTTLPKKGVSTTTPTYTAPPMVTVPPISIVPTGSPSVAVPVVVKSKDDLSATAAENPYASSDMVLRSFYNFLPREQKMMKFNGFPMWLVPEGSNIPSGSRILLSDVKKALQKASVEGAPVKVDTSLPGKRKRMLLEAQAKVEKMGDKVAEILSGKVEDAEEPKRKKAKTVKPEPAVKKESEDLDNANSSADEVSVTPVKKSKKAKAKTSATKKKALKD